MVTAHPDMLWNMFFTHIYSLWVQAHGVFITLFKWFLFNSFWTSEKIKFQIKYPKISMWNPEYWFSSKIGGENFTSNSFKTSIWWSSYPSHRDTTITTSPDHLIQNINNSFDASIRQEHFHTKDIKYIAFHSQILTQNCNILI